MWYWRCDSRDGSSCGRLVLWLDQVLVAIWIAKYWMLSSSFLSFLRCGSQITHPYSSIGRTWVLYKCRIDSGEQCDIYPRSLRALQQTLSMCLDHVRSSDSQMPRYLKCLTFSIWKPLSEKDGQCDLLRREISMTLVLLAFRVKWFATVQLLIASMSFWKSQKSESDLISLKSKMSSANKNSLLQVTEEHLKCHSYTTEIVADQV